MGDRPGLPWETSGQNFSTWWETTKLCMNQPSHAFRIMRLSGGIGQPMMYSGMGLAIGLVGRGQLLATRQRIGLVAREAAAGQAAARRFLARRPGLALAGGLVLLHAVAPGRLGSRRRCGCGCRCLRPCGQTREQTPHTEQ